MYHPFVGSHAHRAHTAGARRRGSYRSRGRQAVALLAAAVGATCGGRAAVAVPANIYYDHSGGGDWFTSQDPYFGWRFDASGLFAPADFPPANSNVFIYTSGTNGVASAAVTFNATNSTANNLSSLSIGSNNTLSQALGSIAVAGDIQVARNAAGTYVMSGGTTTASDLFVGGGGGSNGTGTFDLSGGSVTVHKTSFGYTSVGASGVGVFNHSGGALTTDLLVIANSDPHGSQPGTYNMSNGASVHTTSDEDVGGDALGTFNQTGGSNRVDGFLTVGFSGTGSGAFTLSGGTIQASGEIIGRLQTGGFNQTGGSNSFGSGGLTVGSLAPVGGSPGGNGTYNLSGGTLSGTAAAIVGASGTGVFNHTAGMFTAGSLVLGNSSNGTNAAASGSYSMSNAAVVHIGDLESIGDSGVGSFAQTGGTHTIAGDLLLGDHPGAIGLYTLSADTGPSTLAVNGNEFVGGASAGGWIRGGTLIQSGGVHTIGSPTSGGQLLIADAAGSTGAYNLSGGMLAVQDSIYVGNYGQGVYDQSGGTASVIAQFGGMSVGYAPAASGSATLSAGTLSVPDQENIGYQGAGTFDQSGGSNSANSLSIATSPGSTGTYTLSGGTLTITANTTVGNGGVGTFIQTGGTHAPADLFVGGFGTGRGTYSMTNGALVIADKAFIGMLGGAGTFNQSGGTTTIANLLQIGGGTAGGVINLSGGSFSDLFTINNGTFNQSGGVAVLGPLSGSNGVTLVGGLGPTAQLNVTSFVQSSLTIRSNGLVTVAHNALRVTNSVSTLSILGTGSLDLGNNALLVNNGVTTEAIVRTYLRNAYNANASGIGDWNGKGGITSADAIASHNGANPDFHVSVGYVNGSYANDPLIGGSIPGQPGLATNQTLIRPALYGDYNLDGSVDDTDLAIFSGLGQYNQPNPKFGWLGGDLNHDGKVDDTDLLIFSGAGNYNGPSYGAPAAGGASHASAIPSLTGHAEANGDIVLAGAAGDGVLDFVYDPSTGHLTLSYDGDPRVTSAQPFQVVRFKSAGSHFIPANFNQTAFGAGVTATTAALNGTASGSNSVPDGYDMGAVLPTGLAVSGLTSDLTLQWNVFGGGLTLKNGDVVVPEPCAISLLGILAVRLRRSRRRAGSAAFADAPSCGANLRPPAPMRH